MFFLVGGRLCDAVRENQERPDHFHMISANTSLEEVAGDELPVFVSPSSLPFYCIRTQPKKEHLAATRLRELLGIEVYCPRIRFRRSTRRGPVWFMEALFPGYLFASFALETHLRAVRFGTGVLDVVSFAGIYAEISREQLRELHAMFGPRWDTTLELRSNLAPGDTVLIEDGPFRGFYGTVRELKNSRQRAALLLDFLGGLVQTEMPVSALSKPDDSRATRILHSIQAIPSP